ncbi:MAG: tRNA preQ1(34) S-adenosylmethionine ribosyltransferase-isomerase QueA [Caulobacterales bacterium]|uniref:tRNA preQ1(34) S-adenosylmethionine ribosyltransferase-isomerase QueA n=1 Tax=Glycocaulis sp. TaxID=1969725 RepID=UPI003F9F9A7D
MKLSDFDFDLPEDRIALRPARPRDAARLLHVAKGGALGDHTMLELPGLLQPGDLLVLNNTSVIPAALTGERPARDAGGGGPARIELNLHTRMSADSWRAFARPAKRLRPGDVLQFAAGLSALVLEKADGGDIALEFNRSGAALDEALESAGNPPLPPYIASKRAPDAADRDDYQTMFSDPARKGSVAAPTAGLHFTPRLFDALAARGVNHTTLTLHVGAGTFLPVKTENVAEHTMHAEWYEIGEDAAAAINAARAAGGRIVPVGTTALRTLESAADAHGTIKAGSAETAIFITPGYDFRITDALLTNFHLPKSTLFMLVSALAGLDVMRGAYAHAIAQHYRFFSYGDACLIERR